MAINKVEKLDEIGFLIFVLGVFVALIGGVINAIKTESQTKGDIIDDT